MRGRVGPHPNFHPPSLLDLPPELRALESSCTTEGKGWARAPAENARVNRGSDCAFPNPCGLARNRESLCLPPFLQFMVRRSQDIHPQILRSSLKANSNRRDDPLLRRKRGACNAGKANARVSDVLTAFSSWYFSRKLGCCTTHVLNRRRLLEVLNRILIITALWSPATAPRVQPHCCLHFVTPQSPSGVEALGSSDDDAMSTCELIFGRPGHATLVRRSRGK